MEADEPDPELGYIVAEAAEHAAFHDVRRFVEKPTFEEASRLLRFQLHFDRTQHLYTISCDLADARSTSQIPS